jgi:hypothetical protein
MSSTIPARSRSRERIRLSDLQRLADIARSDRDDFFQRHPRWSALYSHRLLCVALCQGAAWHFVDGKNGVKGLRCLEFFLRDYWQANFSTSRCSSRFRTARPGVWNVDLPSCRLLTDTSLARMKRLAIFLVVVPLMIGIFLLTRGITAEQTSLVWALISTGLLIAVFLLFRRQKPK